MNSKDIPPIYFYIPREKTVQIEGRSRDFLIEKFSYGKYSWTLQTYLRLKESGFACELIDSLPEEGIVLSHRDSLPDNLCPSRNVLLVCLRSDRCRHPYAQLHVVQNPQDTMHRFRIPLWYSWYLPLWPQPGLISRDPGRGDKFENVAYFGLPIELDEQLCLPQWSRRLEQLGFSWRIVDRKDWHDYSDVDVVVAVRKFGRNPYRFKPATKLYNAWLAAVPAVLGWESSFRSQRKSRLDYLEVVSLDGVVDALIRLRRDKKLRQDMVSNGKARSHEFSQEKIISYWRDFIVNKAVPLYWRWRNAREYERWVFVKYRSLFLSKY